MLHWIIICITLDEIIEMEKDGRKNNKGVKKAPGEKKMPITFYVKDKNKEAIKAKVEPIIKKLDK